MKKALKHRISRLLRGSRRVKPAPTLWYSPAYRVPLFTMGLDMRRADLVVWSALDLGVIRVDQVVEPRRVSYSEMSLVHEPHVLDLLSSPADLAPIFGASVEELPSESLVEALRLGTGATVMAARRALAGVGPQLNLLGGFHHASPKRAGGFSVLNDVAISMASLRKQGFEGSFAVLDLDAHPPDGTADCVEYLGLKGVWLGSISGSDWGELDNVDETFLPGGDDRRYLLALDKLLARMPKVELVYVLCGGDVLDGDRHGGLKLSLDGAFQRDLKVARRLADTPTVWLAAGGYSDNAWLVLLNTLCALALRAPVDLPEDYDPVRAQFSKVAKDLSPPVDELFGDLDIAEALGMRPPGGPRLLGIYTSEWIEAALHRFGVLAHVERLGYEQFQVKVAHPTEGDRVRLFGKAEGERYMLLETVLDRVSFGGERYLFVNWLTLRHPLGSKGIARDLLPNQEVPGLGLAREAGEMLRLIARRLTLRGVALRPAAYHVAYTARHDFAFGDPERQGRFEALERDLSFLSVAERSIALERGEVFLGDNPYRWEPELMLSQLSGERCKAVEPDNTFRLPGYVGKSAPF